MHPYPWVNEQLDALTLNTRVRQYYRPILLALPDLSFLEAGVMDPTTHSSETRYCHSCFDSI